MEEAEIKKITPYSLLSTVIALQGDFAKLEIAETKELINWPKTYLPSDLIVGQKLYLRLGTQENLDEEYQIIARKLLEEMIN